MDREVLVMRRGEQTYAFIIDLSDSESIRFTLNRSEAFAENPDMGFTWMDAVKVQMLIIKKLGA